MHTLSLKFSLYPHTGVSSLSLMNNEDYDDDDDANFNYTLIYAFLICCCGCVLTPVSVTGVALLGWSSLNG